MRRCAFGAAGASVTMRCAGRLLATTFVFRGASPIMDVDIECIKACLLRSAGASGGWADDLRWREAALCI